MSEEAWHEMIAARDAEISRLHAAGNLLAEEVRYMLEECSDDARQRAIHAWNEAIGQERFKCPQNA